MILQVNKFIQSEITNGEEARVLVDMYEGVKSTQQTETCTHIYFEDGSMKTFSPGDLLDGVFRLTHSYLLNNDGKTLRRVF